MAKYCNLVGLGDAAISLNNAYSRHRPQQKRYYRHRSVTKDCPGRGPQPGNPKTGCLIYICYALCRPRVGLLKDLYYTLCRPRMRIYTLMIYPGWDYVYIIPCADPGWGFIPWCFTQDGIMFSRLPRDCYWGTGCPVITQEGTTFNRLARSKVAPDLLCRPRMKDYWEYYALCRPRMRNCHVLTMW